MVKNQHLDEICEYIYDGNINDAILLLNQHPNLINTKSARYDNKTLLMCALSALENSSYLSLAQKDLSKFISIIIQNPKLNLKNTDNFGNTALHLAFKYARSTDNELSNTLFNIGEFLLKLIKDENDLKKIVNKKSKSYCKKSQKIFLQYVFPNLQEEVLSEQEIDNLKHLQKRIFHLLLKIFHFKDLLESILQDPIANSITTANTKLTKNDLINDYIVQSIIKIYQDNISNEQTLIAKLQDYITVNQKFIEKATSKDKPDLIITNIVNLIERFKKYVNYINKLTPNKLGLEYDKNKH